MEQIQHKYISVQGLKLHVADIRKGSNVVVFLHGFPEIWYSWWHQMVAAANAGFRAIAPDYRGYGLSDPPPQSEKTSYRNLASDILGILDSLAIPKGEKFVPNLEIQFMSEGPHFVQEQSSDEVNQLIITFLEKARLIANACVKIARDEVLFIEGFAEVLCEPLENYACDSLI